MFLPRTSDGLLLFNNSICDLSKVIEIIFSCLAEKFSQQIYFKSRFEFIPKYVFFQNFQKKSIVNETQKSLNYQKYKGVHFIFFADFLSTQSYTYGQFKKSF